MKQYVKCVETLLNCTNSFLLLIIGRSWQIYDDIDMFIVHYLFELMHNFPIFLH